MRTQGSPEELERGRRLAVQRLLEGYSADEVADSLDVSPRTVWRWLALYRGPGPAGLAARPVSGRPPKLTTTPEEIARRWWRDSPPEHGFPTERWSAPRLAQLIPQGFGVRLHPRSRDAWLRDRGFTPPEPPRGPRGRHPAAIEAWRATDGPRLKTRRGDEAPRSP